MAITINADGIQIKVDTADELRQALTVVREQMKPHTKAAPASSQPVPSPAPVASATASDSADQFQSFYARTSEQPRQQALLRMLLNSPSRTDADLCGTLGLTGNSQLRGLLIGIQRRASNRSLPDPIETEVKRVPGGKRVYVYRASKPFKDAMNGYAGGQQELENNGLVWHQTGSASN